MLDKIGAPAFADAPALAFSFLCSVFKVHWSRWHTSAGEQAAVLAAAPHLGSPMGASGEGVTRRKLPTERLSSLTHPARLVNDIRNRSGGRWPVPLAPANVASRAIVADTRGSAGIGLGEPRRVGE